MTGIEFFTKHIGCREPSKELQKLQECDVLALEATTCSIYSPGPVKSEEHLWRQLVNPTHFDEESGELKVTAFSDAASIGCSVNRGFANPALLLEVAQRRVDDLNEKAPGKNLNFHALVRLECADVRDIKTNINTPGGVFRRGVVVLDTAKPDDDAHADICQIVGEPAQGRSVRSALRELANGYLTRVKAQ